MPTYDVENTNSTNKGGDLLLVYYWVTEGVVQVDRGTGELLYIDQHVLNESQMRRKNLAIAWTDFRKAYDMVPQNWIIDSLKLNKISD